MAALEVSDTKSDILDELLEQAKASRDAPEAVPGEHRDADVTGSSLLDHLLDKAMKEKVSRDSDSVSSGAITQDQESSRSQEDDGQKSRFKYLFFEILTPDEYNDIVYLGEDLMDPMEESMENMVKSMEEKMIGMTHGVMMIMEVMNMEMREVMTLVEMKEVMNLVVMREEMKKV